MTKDRNCQVARDYIAAVTAGVLSDALLTDDMTCWMTSGDTVDRKRYQFLVRLLAEMCAEPLRFTLQALTADEDRVVVEASSETTLVNGEAYAQTYVFVLRIRDGRIAALAEHYNPLIAQEKLLPLMPAAMERLAARDAAISPEKHV